MPYRRRSGLLDGTRPWTAFVALAAALLRDCLWGVHRVSVSLCSASAVQCYRCNTLAEVDPDFLHSQTASSASADARLYLSLDLALPLPPNCSIHAHCFCLSARQRAHLVHGETLANPG